MNENCSSCGQDFEPEIGFYYGAMYISYALSSAILIPLVFVLGFYFQLETSKIVMILVAFTALFYFWILRVSRSIWIHISIAYQPDILKNKQP